MPAELSLEENIGLARLFVTEQLASRGFAADWSIHQGANGNIHAHILLTIRPLTEHGFGAKREAMRDPETGEVLRDKRGRILYAFGNPWGGKADLLVAAGAMGRLREPAFGASRARCPRRSQKP